MRKHKRLTLDLLVAVKSVSGAVGSVTFLLRTVDISAGGAMFRATHSLPVGMDVSIMIFLQSDPWEKNRYVHIAFHGKVVRSQPGCFAVAFVEAGQFTRLQGLSGL